jgi:hypothetical protein
MRLYVFRLAILSLALLGVSVVRGDDQQIAQQIMQKLKAEKDAGALKGFSIDLQVDEGTVWLSGRVANQQQHERALDLARRVPGVQQVVDDLTVTAPAASNPTASAKATPALKAAATKQTTAMPVAATPLPTVQINPMYNEPTPATKPQSSGRNPNSPANNSVLNNVSKVLVSTVNGGHELEAQQTPTKSVQPASVSQDVASAIGAGSMGASPIGSGVDGSVASSRRSMIEAAPPVPNVPQPLTAAVPQSFAAAPQAAMVPMQMPYMIPVYAGSQMPVPLAMGPARTVNYQGQPMADGAGGAPVPMYLPGSGVGIAPARYDHPTMPGYAWPSYAAYPNYAAVTYPKQYSPTAWPYIGPFYPYPQVPLGWRKVTMEWDDGWWMLDFKDRRTMYNRH